MIHVGQNTSKAQLVLKDIISPDYQGFASHSDTSCAWFSNDMYFVLICMFINDSESDVPKRVTS